MLYQKTVKSNLCKVLFRHTLSNILIGGRAPPFSVCPLNFMFGIYFVSDPDKTKLPIWSLLWGFESVVSLRQCAVL